MKICLKLFILIVAFAALALPGCSDGGGNAITPDSDVRTPSSPESRNGTTGLWGLWEIGGDFSKGDISIVKLREADLALNVLGFLEPPVLVNMSIDFETLVFEENYIGVDVILKHPFITNEHIFSGFDVKGIVIGPWLENADGLTRYFNPNEWTGTPFGYHDGLLGVPDAFANYPEEYNGYKYFANDIDFEETVLEYFSDPDNLANRGMFSEGGNLKRHYDLRFGGDYTDIMVFNYAIYASYDWPDGDPPFELDDFSISTANQAEPVFIEVTENYNSLGYDPDSGIGSGAIDMDITIFDWDKPVNPEIVWIRAPGVIATTQAMFVSDDDANRRTYNVNASGVPLTSADLDIIVSVTSEKLYGDYYFLDLMPDSHPLYDDEIETKFIHKVEVLEVSELTIPYEDPMDTTTEVLWTVENTTPYHTASIEWAQAGTEWQSNGGAGVGGNYQNFMDTYLVSPLIIAPADGDFNMILRHRYYMESGWDYAYLKIRYEGGLWLDFTGAVTSFTGGSNGYPDYVTEVYASASLTPGAAFQLGFRFFSDYLVYSYDGWFIDHLILTENNLPTCGAVSGPASVNSYGIQQYSVTAGDPDGDDITYAWEIGDDDPPQYDDGPGNPPNSGNINIDWQSSGDFIVDCKVTDDGAPNLEVTSTSPLTVSVFIVPANPGPSEDFDSWPPTGWTFNDHTTIGNGLYWGQTNFLSVNCLDADGVDDSCPGSTIFEEARWNVTIPSSTNCMLKITHAVDLEGTAGGMFFDAGMLFIDDNLIEVEDCLSGFPNDADPSTYYWVDNTYLPTVPEDVECGWTDPNPDPWGSGFEVSYMDLSSYSDGSSHDIGFIFHSDSSINCDSGSNYHTWMIDKVEIFYD